MNDEKKPDEPAEAMTIDLSEATDESNAAVIPQDAATAATEPAQQTTPQSSPAKPPAHEARSTPRYRVRWRAEIIINAQTTYYGHLKDISISGAAVLMEHNIKSVQSVTLFLEIPSEHTFTFKEPHILQVEGKVISTIYEGDSGYFRTGVAFKRFVPGNELAFLDNYLKNNCLELP